MIIMTLPTGPIDTNAYILVCPQTGKAAIVDPGIDSAPRIIQYLEENSFVPVIIILTHSHWDHIGNVALLKKKYNIPVYIHKLDSPNLEKPGSDKMPCQYTIEGTIPDFYIDEGDIISVGELKLHVIHTPGHSPGSVCYYCPEKKLLFSGDTLFKQSIGNLSFPGGQPDLMWTSLKKLEILPPETKVYTGHGEKTSIGDESWLPRAKEIFQ